MTSVPHQPAALLAEGAMRPLQWLVVAVMLFLNMTDGFDILAISFAGPGIARDFGLAPSQLGILFSSGFVGTALGSVLVAPIADRVGRKPMLLACLATLAAGMLLSAGGHSLAALLASRLVTGIGAGGLLPVINAMVAELANDRRRPMAISIAQSGFALGALAGGLVSAVVLAAAGWREIFLTGAAFSAACFVLVMATVPESPDFLRRRQPRGALARINHLLIRLDRPVLAHLAPVPPRKASRLAADLFRAPLRRPTILLGVCYVLTMMAYYAFINWLPKLQVMAGTPVTAAVISVTVATAGSVVGGLGYGLLANPVGRRRLTAAYFLVGAAGAVAVAGFMPADILGIRIGSFALGLAIGGGITGLFAFLAAIYPTALRSTASGIIIGAGRGGAIVGPLLCGVALEAGVGARTIVIVTGALLVAAAATLPPATAARGA